MNSSNNRIILSEKRKNAPILIDPKDTKVGSEAVEIYDVGQSRIRRINEGGVLEKFKNWSDYKEIKKGNGEIIKSINNYYIGTIREISELKMQQLTEAIQDVLVRGKTIIRSDRASFFMEEKKNLQLKLDSLTDEFISHVERRCRNIESLSEGLTKDMAMSALEDSIRSWDTDLKIMLDDFSATLKEYQPS